MGSPGFDHQQGKRNPALCLTHILSILLFLKRIVYVHDVCVSEDVNVHAMVFVCKLQLCEVSSLSYFYVGSGDQT